MQTEHTQALIVGGGITGLTAALLLHHHGVRTVLVERHHDTSPQPKARRFNHRSLEIYRGLGLIEDITEASAALANFHGMLTGLTLAEARWPESTPSLANATAQHEEINQHTPVQSILCPQDLLEPVLYKAGQARGIELRFGTELGSLSQDKAGVTAIVHDPAGEHTIRADYVLAADGARSPIRESLGIPRDGLGHLADNLDVYFGADLTELVRGREFNLCQIDNPAASGAFVSVNGTDRWLFSTSNFPVEGGFAADLPASRWAELLRTVVGLPELDVDVLSRMSWESAMYVAESFARGRIFLAGDAAHAMPPMAAAGANTAIQDVHNLAWKLAAVLDGHAAPELLATYQAERYPVGYATAEYSSQVSGHLGDMVSSAVSGAARPLSLAASLLGTQYTEGAMVPDGRGEPPMDTYAPAGRPGTRIPHRYPATVYPHWT